jgi:hypothetical protein
MVDQKRIGFGYDTFLIYVRRHLRPAAEPVPAAPASRTKGLRASLQAPVDPQLGAAESWTPRVPVQAPPVQDQLPGFTFNAAPNREELI